MKALTCSALTCVFVAMTVAQGSYTDPQKRFSITPPTGWQVNRPDDAGPVVFMTADGKARIILMPLDIPEEARLSAVISAYEELMGATQPGVSIEQLGEENIRIDGKPALLRKYRVSVPGEEVRLAEAAFVKDRTFALTLHAHATESTFPQHRSTFESCRRTLRVPAASAQASPAAKGAAAEIQAKLEALEAARKADIITGADYEKKKAEFEAQLAAARVPVLDEAAKQKLEILERAYRAGLLNETEYARKKAEIEAAATPGAPPLDAAARAKLEALEAAHRSGILSDEEYSRKRRELVGGALPAPDQAAPKQPAPAITSEKHAGKTYRHVIGFSLWYPEGWKVQEQDDFLQIIPPDAGTSPEGPTEIYVIIGDTIAGEGITSPQDPRIAQYMEQAVSELCPFVQRTGGIGTVPMSQGQGARIDWKGTNQQGKTVCARTYVGILRDSGIALLALAFEENLKRREATLAQIFASFGLGEGERDPQLVGTWGLVSTGAITNTSPWETDYSRARAVSETQSTLQLLADGTWNRNDVSEFIAISGGLTVGSGPERKSSRGKWNAAQGSLYLIWDDGSWQDYKYQVQASPQSRRLILTGEKHREFWQSR